MHFKIVRIKILTIFFFLKGNTTLYDNEIGKILHEMKLSKNQVEL